MSGRTETPDAKASGDGRVQLSNYKHLLQFAGSHSSSADDVERKHSRLSLFGKGRKEQFDRIPSQFTGVPRMNICILITGSRGDVQPFIALGQALQAAPYHHNVRIGTHPNFREFVKENDLAFFSIGGDPEQLMAYAEKNPGIIPGLDSIRAGDITARKNELETMLMGALKACTEPADAYDMERIDKDNPPEPFVADAIISNPPTYASLHIAEKLCIPLHLMFTMPWSPTTAFPHPLAQLDSSRTDRARLNYLSYTQMEAITWLGLADIINRFRRNALGLDSIDPSWGAKIIPHLKIPFTYCWSPALIPRPSDWADHISISGFFFLDKGSTYEPEPELKSFLEAGDPPVYIGFGSIVADDPTKFTKLIFDAVKKAGVRALVSKGWSKIGGDEVPDNVFLLGNVPHDWLFKHVSAVVHHGGAGTCAIGLKLGCPTVIVPFFGDQFWWAGIVERAGAGPKAVPYKEITAEKLADNITKALQPEVKSKAQEIAKQMEKEEGVKTAGEQFHDLQQTKQYACFICPEETAVWRIRRTNIQLGPHAVAVLVQNGRLKPRDLKLVKHKRWYVEEGVPGPLTGIVAALVALFAHSALDVRDFKRNVKLHQKRKKQTKTTPSEKQNGSASSEDEKTTYHSAGVDPERSHLQSFGRLGKELAVDVASFPVNLLYNIAVGCHNAPLTFFNDRTVRIRPRINGVGTGLEVAGKEIVFGVYDSVTGIVKHPYHGYKNGKDRKGGPAWGAVKGAGRGIGGIVFRLGAMGFAIPGYGLKGVEQGLLLIGKNSEGLPDLDSEIMHEMLHEDRHGKRTREERERSWREIAGGNEILEQRVAQVAHEMLRCKEEDLEREKEIFKRWDELMLQRQRRT